MDRKTLPAAALAAALMGFGPAAQAQVTISVAPPAPRVETVPAPRAGWVWAPGHWQWQGGGYAWVEGHWVAERPGYEYRHPMWVQRANGTWVLVGNSWERRGPWGDRDGDGVANRYDRDRDGDGIANRYDNNRNRTSPNADFDRDGVANRYDRDTDGDGVRNARDRHPYDRQRS